ncbi:MAG: ABC transporter permease [Bacteroidales bacterium]
MQRSSMQYIFMILSGLVILFVAAPVIALMLGPHITDYIATAGDKEAMESITNTLLAAFSASLLMALPGIPLAWLLARKQFAMKGLLQGLIDIPVVIPHTAAGIAVLTVISPATGFGQHLDSLGLNLVGTKAGIATAMAFVSVPFLINSARQGFEMVSEHYEKTSLSLGVSPAKTFFRVSLPLAWRSILGGMVMMFARGMSEFGAVVIIAYYPITTPTLIFERFGAYGLKQAQPLAALFVFISLLLFIVLRWLANNRRFYAKAG